MANVISENVISEKDFWELVGKAMQEHDVRIYRDGEFYGSKGRYYVLRSPTFFREYNEPGMCIGIVRGKENDYYNFTEIELRLPEDDVDLPAIQALCALKQTFDKASVPYTMNSREKFKERVKESARKLADLSDKL